MALNFPNTPTNAQSYVDPNGHTWVYETATNSWTAQGAPVAGMVYKGPIDVTTAPPTGATTGSLFTVSTGGTPNVGFVGLPTNVPVGSQVIFDGAKWQLMSTTQPDATEATRGIVELATAAETTAGTDATRAVHPAGLKVELDKLKLWTRTGTVVSPANAGDQVHTATGKLTVGGTAAAPSIEIKADGGIVANTNGLVYDAATKRLAIGTASAGSYSTYGNRLVVYGTGTDGPGITIATGTSDTGSIYFADGTTGNEVARGAVQYAHVSDALLFQTAATERARIDSSGRLLVGTSSAPTAGDAAVGLLRVQGFVGSATGEGIVSIARGKVATSMISGETVGQLIFTDNAGNPFAKIYSTVDGTVSSTSDLPGSLSFSTTADGASTPTEAMRIQQDQTVLIGRTGNLATVHRLALNANANALGINTNTGTAEAITFYSGGTKVGNVTVTPSATQYNTASDYRLKENVTPVLDGIIRLQQLKPNRFNFLAEPSKTVDGFLAHEVQTVVPECVTGAKDAVDADGNPQYQSIDQSKLVPLLTAALQEAISEIETLKARVVALESA